MKRKIQITLMTIISLVTTNLFAQEQTKNADIYYNTSLVAKYDIINKVTNLGKKGAKVKLDSLNYFDWNTNTNLFDKNGIAVKFSYDTNWNNNFIMLSSYSISDSKWLEVQKYFYTFNDKNKQTLAKVMTSKGNDVWTDLEKTETSYDNKGNRNVLKFYQWNENNYNWIKNYSYYYYYDTGNKLITEIDTFLYNNITTILKKEYLYDSKGNNIENTQMSGAATTWVNNIKNSITYDANNNATLKLNFKWNDVTNVWDSVKKEVNVIDVNNNIIEKNTYGYSSTNSWGNTKKITNVFNNLVPMADIVWPNSINFENDGYKNQISTLTLEEFSNNVRFKYNLQKYYYKLLNPTNGTNELTETNINIYPNPSNGMININTNETIENINITDVNGKLIYHQINNSPIDLSQHAKGIYFVNITTEKGVVNKKIVLN